MAHSRLTRLALPIRDEDLALLRHVRARLAAQIGRASYVATVLYGLRLAAVHLGVADDEASLASGWLPGTPAPPAGDGRPRPPR